MLSAFEREVERLGLTDPAQYATSPELVAWVRRNWRSRYVPESLLKKLDLDIYQLAVGTPEIFTRREDETIPAGESWRHPQSKKKGTALTGEHA